MSRQSPSTQESPAECLALVAGALERHLPELCEQEAQRFLATWPKDPGAGLAWLFLGEARLQLGDLGRAESAFFEAQKRAPAGRAGEIGLRLAQCAFERGDWARAVPRCREVLGLGPEELPSAQRAAQAPWALSATLLLGDSELRLGRAASAESAYLALVEDPGPAGLDALYGSAFAARDLAQAPAAVERIERFLKRAPDDGRAPELEVLAGQVELGRGAAAAALSRFDRALAGLDRERRALPAPAQVSAPDARRYEARLGRARACLELLRWDDALAALEGLEAQLEPAQRSQAGEGLALLSARALLGQGRGEQALVVLQPHNGPAVERQRGLTLEALGRRAEAAEAFLRVDDAYGDYAAAHAALGAGDPAAAKASAERGLARGPGPYAAATRALYGEALVHLGEGAAAVVALEAALVASAGTDQPALIPAERVRAQRLLAWAQLAKGTPGAAEAPARAALVGESDAGVQSECRFLIARALEAQGQAERALSSYREYLDAARGPTPSALFKEALWRAASLAKDASGDAWLEELAALPDAGDYGPLAYAALGERCAARGDFEASRACYQRLIEAHPKHERIPEARYAAAFAAHRQGDWVAARAFLARLLERSSAASPESSWVPAALELDLFALSGLLEPVPADAPGGAVPVAPGKSQQALAAAVQADLERLRDPRALLEDDGPERLGRAALRVGRALAEGGLGAEARACYEQASDALATLPAGATLPAFRSLSIEAVFAELDGGDPAAAEARARALLANAPLDAPLAEALFFVAEARFERGEDAAAEALYALAEPAAGQWREAALYKRGFAATRRGDKRSAATAFAAQLESFPAGELAGEAGFLLAESRAALEDDPGAIRALEGLLARFPEHALAARALELLGQAKARSGDPAGSLAAFDRLLEREPAFVRRAGVELGRGRAQRALGATRPARQAFARVLELDRGRFAAQAQLELAAMSAAAGDPGTALSEYLKVAVLYEPGDEVAQALFGAGQALEALGKAERAREQYAELLESYPESDSAKRAKERLAALGAR